MSCKITKINGVTAIVCSRGSRRKSCRWCARPHMKLCDFKLRDRLAGRTCDAEMCDAHAYEIGPNEHLCPPHRRLVEEAFRE